MEYGLTVLERVRLLDSLPPEGNVITLKLIRGIAEKLGFSPEDHEKFGIHAEGQKGGQNVHWNDAGNEPTMITFADAEVDIIKNQLKRMDAESRMKPDMIGLFEKFCR